MQRREFLQWLGTAAAALALPGCGASGAPIFAPGVYNGAARPRPLAPGQAVPLPQAGRHVMPEAPSYASVTPASASASASPAIAAPRAFTPAARPAAVRTVSYAPVPRRPAGARNFGPSMVARAAWGGAAPNAGRLQAMNGVTRITVHHDGNPKPNHDATPDQAARSIRLIQAEHRKRMGAGDIGYHFIIDRTGRIWQGREEQYQGAHVASANANNLGVLCLGNTDLQAPTPAQMAALETLLRRLMARYGVPAARVYGHRDLANTRCPGDQLARQLQQIKSRL